MQHVGLFVTLLIIAGLTVTVTKWPGGLHMTFSQHVAISRWAKVYYALLFMIVLPILFLFFAVWFVPMKHLPNSFLWLAAIAILFQIFCTWVPEEGGKKTTIHRILTAISCIALLPQVALIGSFSTSTALVRLFAWVALALMTILLLIAAKNQKGFRYALLLQISYYALFFAVILVTTYL